MNILARFALRFMGLSITLILFTLLIQVQQVATVSGATNSPIPTPFVTPVLTDIPSKCHTFAIAYISRQHSIPADRLIAGSYVSNEEGAWVSDSKEDWFEFPAIQQRVCSVKVSVKGTDNVYQVYLDEDGSIVDLKQLRSLEHETVRIKCGKFDSALCAQWPFLADDEQIEVAIWLEELAPEAIYDIVASKYPAALQPQKGLPFDISHPDYERALREVEELKIQVYRESEEPLLDFLRAKGSRAAFASSHSPIVFASLTKSVIAAAADRDDIASIYLLGSNLNDRLNSLISTIRVSRFWNAGHLGDGVKVAIVEDDPVNFTNPYLAIPSPIMGWRKAVTLGESRPTGRFVEKCPPIKWHQVFPEAF